MLHDDIVTLGRVLQWKLDFKKLDKLFISIPAEDADGFINLVKRVILVSIREPILQHSSMNPVLPVSR